MVAVRIIIITITKVLGRKNFLSLQSLHVWDLANYLNFLDHPSHLLWKRRKLDYL